MHRRFISINDRYKNPERIPSRCRIAVPSGVGDVYWVLAKLGDFRLQNNLTHVTLCVQKTTKPRALDWTRLCPQLVDATCEIHFKKDQDLEDKGWSKKIPGADFAMWPNSLIDRGHHLSEWMPKYQLDLELETQVPVVPDPGIVVYASSHSVNNAWFPNRGARWWSTLCAHIKAKTGKEPTLIGAGWDADFAQLITGPHRSLVGQTSLPAIAATMKQAKLVVGIISGMTILANHYRTPCLAIYPDKFLPGFLTSWIKPNTPYIPLKASDVTTAIEVGDYALSLLDSNENKAQAVQEGNRTQVA